MAKKKSKKKAKKKATKKAAPAKAKPPIKVPEVNEKALGYRCYNPENGAQTMTRTTKAAALVDKGKHEAIECATYVLQERTLDGWQDLIV